MKNLILISLVLTGCSTWNEKAAPEVAKYIDTYCATTDEFTRAQLRESINSLTQICDVEITRIDNN